MRKNVEQKLKRLKYSNSKLMNTRVNLIFDAQGNPNEMFKLRSEIELNIFDEAKLYCCIQVLQ